MSKNNKKNVLIIGNTFCHPSSTSFLQKFLKIVQPLAGKIFLISGGSPPAIGNNIYWYDTQSGFKNSKKVNNSLLKIKTFLLMEIKIFNLIRVIMRRNKIDKSFFVGYSFSGLLFLKLKRIKIFLYQGGAPFRLRMNVVSNLLTKIFFEKIPYIISDKIIVEGKGSIQFQNLNRYKKKVIFGPVYVDGNFFYEIKNFKDRENNIGYFGNLTINKGIKKFMDSLPMLEKDKNLVDLKIIFGGKGPLEKEIREACKLYKNIELVGWISHEKLLSYLNELKLFVLPSYSEGLPNIILESMACGTPVLVTPVGAVPDIICDSHTGFIMEDNSAESIAMNIFRAFNHPNLEFIAENAKNLITNEFSYESAVERYKKILNDIKEN